MRKYRSRATETGVELVEGPWEGLRSGVCSRSNDLTAVASRTYIPARQKATGSLSNPFDDGNPKQPR